MTVRADITVDFTLSPRIITVAAPSTALTIQDLHDTLRTVEAVPWNLDEPRLLSSAGKENLGGGTLVGITSTLQNAQLAFAARGGPSYVQCTVSGGNLVAIDGNGDPLSPIAPTAFVQVVLAQSSSATITGQDAVVASLAVLEAFSQYKFVADPVAGQAILYASDGVTVKYTANLYEDVAGTQPYRGKGISRRDPFVEP